MSVEQLHVLGYRNCGHDLKSMHEILCLSFVMVAGAMRAVDSPGMYPQIVSNKFSQKSPPIPKRSATADSQDTFQTTNTDKKVPRRTDGGKQCSEDPNEHRPPMPFLVLEIAGVPIRSTTHRIIRTILAHFIKVVCSPLRARTRCHYGQQKQ